MMTLEECCLTCNGVDLCTSFTFHKNTCFLKTCSFPADSANELLGAVSGWVEIVHAYQDGKNIIESRCQFVHKIINFRFSRSVMLYVIEQTKICFLKIKTDLTITFVS